MENSVSPSATCAANSRLQERRFELVTGMPPYKAFPLAAFLISEDYFMADKKDSGFTVTDRRLFTADGELRQDTPEETEPPKPVAEAKAQAGATVHEGKGGAVREDLPAP